MRLYIGGFGQGKLEYVLEQYKEVENLVLDGAELGNARETGQMLCGKYEGKQVILNHFHLWVKKLLEEQKEVKKEAEALLENIPGIVIISDEIGNGIVPVEPFERKYRDCTGEILIDLAKKAERVERILCGLGQVLKSS